MNNTSDLSNAFQAGANSTINEISIFILGIFFSCLFLISAYMLIEGFKETQNGGKILSLLLLAIRIALMISILMYILL